MSLEPMLATIRKLTFRGDGVAVPDDSEVKPYLVAGGLSGERVEIVEIPMRWGRRARLIQVLEPSPERVDPECGQDARCRGCQLRALQPRAQTKHKEESWRRTLRRVAHIELLDDSETGQDLRSSTEGEAQPDESVEIRWQKTAVATSRDGYRTRSSAQVLRRPSQKTPVQETGVQETGVQGTGVQGPRVLGMRPARGFKEPVDLTRCPAQHPECNALLEAAARALCEDEEILSVDVNVVPGHRQADGNWPRARARVMLAGPGDCGRSAQKVHSETGASVFVGRKDIDDSGAVDEWSLFAGDYRMLVPGVGEQELLAPPDAWVPTSHAIAEQVADVLFEAIDELSLVDGKDGRWSRILELGCGIGTHTFRLARYADEVVGIDGAPGAIDAANLNLNLNLERGREREREREREQERKIGPGDESAQQTADATGRVRFRLGRAEHAIRQLLKKGMRGAELAVLHGMRKPYGESVVNILPAWQTRMVVLVSPAALALARDARSLRDAGYQPVSLRLIDHMPQTYHAMGVMVFLAVE